MVVKADQDRVKTLLKDTITLLCKNGLSFETEFSIEALIGITLDKDDVFLVSIKELVRSEKANTTAKLTQERNEQSNDSDIDSEGSYGSRSSSEGRRRKRRKRKIKTEVDVMKTQEHSTFDAHGNDSHSNEGEPLVKRTFESNSNTLPAVSKYDPDDGNDDIDQDDGGDSSSEDVTFIKQEIDENWSQQHHSNDFSNFTSMEDQGMGSFMGNNLVPVGNQEGNAVWEQTLMPGESRLFQPSGATTSTVTSGAGDPLAEGENQGMTIADVFRETKMSFGEIPDVSESLELKSENTNRKTASDMKQFTLFLAKRHESRDIHQIPPPELDMLLGQFFMSVKRLDGSDYEPASLIGIQASIMRNLKEHMYPYYIRTDDEFQSHRDVLAAKCKLLKKCHRDGKSNKSLPFSKADIEQMYEKSTLGVDSPDALLKTLWLHFTTHFRIKGRQEHNSVRWGDITLKQTTDGKEYLVFAEHATKIRKGLLGDKPGSCDPQIFAEPDNPRCPIKVYKFYEKKRPSDMLNKQDPFYLSPLTKCQKDSPVWFSRQPVGKNKLGHFAATASVEAGLQSRRTIHGVKLKGTYVQTWKQGDTEEGK